MTAHAAETLRRMFAALTENGCEPELTADGSGIVATCPCCNEKRGLLIHFGAPDGREQ